RASDGTRLYGTINSPANSPYAITVGASNSFGTAGRADDVVTTYTSRGPTRSYYTDANGARVHDNIIKPDLVAPGNSVISSVRKTSKLASLQPDQVLSINGIGSDAYMYQSGTS